MSKPKVTAILSLLTKVPAAGAVGPETVDLPRHELIFAHHADTARTDYDIWRRCSDGTQMASLVTEPGRQLQIAVSPDGDEFVDANVSDGQWIAFTAGVGNDRLGTFDLWITRPDGSDRQVLNKAPNTEGWQKWRPGEHYCR